MTSLDVERLVVDFPQPGGGTLRAVDEVSFTLTAGATVALVGESGSGKSTVVRALARLQRTTGGRLALDGREVGTRRGLAAYRRHVQMVFQDPFASLNPAHTVGYHLKRPLLLHRRAARHDAQSAVEALLASVDLRPASEYARRLPHELSGGQRQRVAIARALAPSPRVLLADEPVSMLDASVRLEVLNLLDGLKDERELALLYVTHDLATARHFSSTIMVMYRGEIVERGSSDEVILRPRHPYTQLLAASAPSVRADPADVAAAREARRAARVRRRAAGAAADETGCRFRDRCPFARDICRDHPPDTETADGHAVRCWMYERPSAFSS